MPDNTMAPGVKPARTIGNNGGRLGGSRTLPVRDKPARVPLPAPAEAGQGEAPAAVEPPATDPAGEDPAATGPKRKAKGA